MSWNETQYQYIMHFLKAIIKLEEIKGRIIQHNNFLGRDTQKSVFLFFLCPFSIHTIMRQKNPTVSDNIFSADKTKK